MTPHQRPYHLARTAHRLLVPRESLVTTLLPPSSISIRFPLRNANSRAAQRTRNW
jgi:hypothetical protein